MLNRNALYCEGTTRKCCVPGEPLDCPLVLWKSPNIIGYNKKDVYIESKFVPSMEIIQKIAYESQVTVYVTQAFRIDGIPVDGAIVPPATHSTYVKTQKLSFQLAKS